VQEAYTTPNHQDQKGNPQTQHNQNTQNTKQRKNSKATKERRQVTNSGKPFRITPDFLTQTLNTRRSWKDIKQALKESNC
jgi:hypothetical protein